MTERSHSADHAKALAVLLMGACVIGVGPRAGFHRPDAVVRDLCEVRVEPLADGTVRLHVG